MQHSVQSCGFNFKTVCTSYVYCDYMVWTSEDMHIQRIIWMKSCGFVHWESPLVFKNAVLPELIGKWFSCAPVAPATLNSSPAPDNSSQSTNPRETLYCWCRGPESGAMIACDNSSCLYVWSFWLLETYCLPSSKKWLSPDCRKIPKWIQNCTDLLSLYHSYWTCVYTYLYCCTCHTLLINSWLSSIK